MLAFLQTNTPIVIFNQIVVTLLTVCFLYQVVFFIIGALRGEVAPPKAKKLHPWKSNGFPKCSLFLCLIFCYQILI